MNKCKKCHNKLEDGTILAKFPYEDVLLTTELNVTVCTKCREGDSTQEQMLDAFHIAVTRYQQYKRYYLAHNIEYIPNDYSMN